MRDLIYNYLDANFKLNLKTYVYYLLFDVNTQSYRGISSINAEMSKVFNVDSATFFEVFEDWNRDKFEEVQETLAEINNKFEKITGVEFAFNDIDLKHFISVNDAYVEYVKKICNHQYPDDGMEVCSEEPNALYDNLNSIQQPIDQPVETEDRRIDIFDEEEEDRRIRNEAMDLIVRAHGLLHELGSRIENRREERAPIDNVVVD